MGDALVGASGFVGTSLLRQTGFESRYRRANIADIAGRSFDTVVCAGAPAQKWIANREPDADRANIDGLIAHLRRMHCRTFILISTVDVFRSPTGVDERSAVDESGLHAYGLHRRRLERFVEERFDRRLIVRLPGLVGPGLRKNVIHDLHHAHDLHNIDSRAVFQFYPMVNLWYDIGIALRAGLDLVHLTAAPISVAELALEGFGRPFEQRNGAAIPAYDFRSCHVEQYGATGHYQYGRRETLLAVRAYAQSEPRAGQMTGSDRT